MMDREFKVGDAVRVSAAFLRSICPSARRGWPTTMDPGAGVVVEILPCGTFDLIGVWFSDAESYRTYNSGNLIHQKDNWDEAMRAEHAPRSNFV